MMASRELNIWYDLLRSLRLVDYLNHGTSRDGDRDIGKLALLFILLIKAAG